MAVIIDNIGGGFTATLDRTATQNPCSYRFIFDDLTTNNDSQYVGKTCFEWNGTQLGCTVEGGSVNYDFCATGQFTIRQIYTIYEISPINGEILSILYQEDDTFDITILEYKPRFAFGSGTCCYLREQVVIVPQDLALNNNVCGVLPTPNSGYFVGTGTGTYHEDFYSSFTDDFQTLEYRLFYYDIDAAQYIEEAAAYQKLIIDGSDPSAYPFTFTPDKLAAYRVEATLTNCCVPIVETIDIQICDSVSIEHSCRGQIECNTCNDYVVYNNLLEDVEIAITEAISGKQIHTFTVPALSKVTHGFTEDGVYIFSWLPDNNFIVNVMCQIDECYTNLLKMMLCRSSINDNNCCDDSYLDSRLANVQPMYQTYLKAIEPYTDLNIRYSNIDITNMLNDFKELGKIKEQILDFCILCERNCNGCFNWTNGTCV